MSSTTLSTTSNDECEHCHAGYSLIKRKKTCAICHQNYCANCAPRDRNQNNSYRVCVICQLISNTSTTNERLLELKVKHLRCYLQAKDIPHNTCTEKQELVDLIIRTRHLPFSRLSNQQTSSSANQEQVHSGYNQSNSSSPARSTMRSSKSSVHNSGPFSNLQQTVSSFANQMNNFASNVQDYVTNTVSDVVNNLGEQDQHQSTVPPVNSQPGPRINTAPTSAGASAQTTTHRSTPTDRSQQRTSSTQSTTTSSTTATQRIRRKSLSDIRNEENIEDLNTRELKEILASNFVDYKGCIEKSELIEKVRRLYRDRQNEKLKTHELDDMTATDSELCKICMDAIVDCVFLDCGHMVTCVKCGKLLAECPICRSNIVRVVRVFKS